MFGIAAFSQTSFASLAGTSYAFSIAENFNAADSSTQLSAFLQTATEPVTMGDVGSLAGSFFGSVTETFTPGDSSTQIGRAHV